MKRRNNTHVQRNAMLFNLLIRYLIRPFVWSFDNFQRGMADKATATREVGTFTAMADLGLAFTDMNGDAAQTATALDRGGLPMTCGDAICVDRHVQFAFNDVEMDWLGGFNLSEDYIVSLGSAEHSGRCGIKKDEHFAAAAYPPNPDSTVDAVELVTEIIEWHEQAFAEVLHIPAPFPYVIMLCLDQKTYENARRAIAADKTGKLDPLFVTPDHWNAVQAAGFAALLNGV